MIEVPFTQLSEDALRGVIDAFILREGTDYGHTDYSIEAKRDRVRAQLESGRAVIYYNPDEDHVDLQMVTDSRFVDALTGVFPSP